MWYITLVILALISALDHPRFRVREAATSLLRPLSSFAAPVLTEVAETSTSAEQRRRARMLLDWEADRATDAYIAGVVSALADVPPISNYGKFADRVVGGSSHLVWDRMLDVRARAYRELEREMPPGDPWVEVSVDGWRFSHYGFTDPYDVQVLATKILLRDLYRQRIDPQLVLNYMR